MANTGVPPHNLDAERAVLGVSLVSAETLERLVASLLATDFYLDAHRIIFERLAALHAAGHAVDVVVLDDALRAADELDTVGGTAALARLVEESALAVHLDEYLAIVRREAGKREVIQTLKDSLVAAHNGTGLVDLTSNIIETVTGIAERAEPGVLVRRRGPQPIADVLGDVVRAIDSDVPDFVTTPYPGLDRLLGGGLQRGEMAILGGRPGSGKSALALEVAIYAAQRSHATLIVSREMRNVSLGRRAFAQQAQVSATSLRSGNVDEAERARIERALPRLAALPVWFDDVSETIAQIARTTRALPDLRLVIVDYLQLVRGPKGLDRRLEVEAVSAGLKRLATGRNLTVIVLSSLTPAPVERGAAPARPNMAQLRESRALEHDADVVLLIHRPDIESTDRRLIVDKGRDNETGQIRLAFTGMYQRFQEVPDEHPVRAARPGTRRSASPDEVTL